MIQIEQVEKSFGALHILKGIDLKLEEGKIYAFLGPNGSGKTTLLKCILGMVQPDKGSIVVNDNDVKAGPDYKFDIGYMPQIARFPENLKVEELVNMIKNIRKQASQEQDYLSYFGLNDVLQKKLKNLSGGMKQKVNAVIALMFNPSILILDEPSVGLDPIAHLKLKKVIEGEKKRGKTVLLTTHVLSDVEELADEIIFLLDGRIFFKGTLEALLMSQEEDKLDKAIARMINKDEYDALITPKEGKKTGFKKILSTCL